MTRRLGPSLRPIGLALLLVAAACSEDGKDDGPAANEPAGEVVEVSGDVQVDRGGEVQALAEGQKVFRADVVITGDDGAVTIALYHNNARWSLDAGKRKRVEASVAWRAPEQAGGGILASSEDESTTAAGRHAEKQAADTASTAALVPRGRAEPETAEGTAAEAPAAEAPAAPDPEPATTPAPSPPPPPPPAPRGKKKTTKKRSGGGESDIDELLGDDGGGYGLGLKGGESDADEKPVVTKGEVLVGSGDGTDSSIARTLRKNARRFRTCYQKYIAEKGAVSGKIVIDISIGKGGEVSAVKLLQSSLPAPISTCVTRAARRIRFPEDAAGESVEFPLVFQTQ